MALLFEPFRGTTKTNHSFLFLHILLLTDSQHLIKKDCKCKIVKRQLSLILWYQGPHNVGCTSFTLGLHTSSSTGVIFRTMIGNINANIDPCFADSKKEIFNLLAGHAIWQIIHPSRQPRSQGFSLARRGWAEKIPGNEVALNAK